LTACGLSVANYLAGSPVRIHAIGVCDDAAYFYKHIDDMLIELGLSSETSARSIIRVVDGYKGMVVSYYVHVLTVRKERDMHYLLPTKPSSFSK
jgi:hypothetical protein